MSAPHLPPKVARARLYDRYFLSWLLVIVVIAILASCATTLSIIAWFTPSFIAYTNTTLRREDRTTPVTDPTTIGQTRQRLVGLYDKKKKIGTELYPMNARVGEAVLLSVDGWAVLPRAAYRAGEEGEWEGIDYRGTIYSVRAAAYDAVSRLLYVRFSGEGFRISPIAPWEQVQDDPHVFAIDDEEWKPVTLVSVVGQSREDVYPIWQSLAFEHVEPGQIPAASILVTAAGDLAGFVTDGATIIPSWIVSTQLGSILSAGRVSYRGVPWEGYPIRGINRGPVVSQYDGFYITKSPTRATTSTVGRGDVIVRVNRQPISPAELGRVILSAPETFTVTVMRQGEEIDMPVTKVPIGVERGLTRK